MTKFLLLALALLLLTGCGTLLPKRVEFFQDKVQEFPTPSERHEELIRQAADLLHQRALETEKGVSLALLTSLGSPLHPWTRSADELASSLSYRNAVHQAAVRRFAESNNENSGKKIEGTGAFSVPYFVWILIVGGLLFVGVIVLTVVWGALKMFALSNPPLALGLNAVQMGARGAGQMVTQLIKGGQRFKNKLEDVVQDSGLREKILETFRDAQSAEQDQTTQQAVKHLKGK